LPPAGTTYEGLTTYLNDHLAGATAGLKLAQLGADEHQNSEYGAFFAEIASEIKLDYDVLTVIMGALNAEPSATKSALAEVGSAIMQPKFTGGDDALNVFVTLETLSIGVEGKACMWRALKTIADDPTLDGVQLDELIERAEDQRARIETKRIAVAPQALAHTVNA
jgi:hypothetical protein